MNPPTRVPAGGRPRHAFAIQALAAGTQTPHASIEAVRPHASDVDLDLR